MNFDVVGTSLQDDSQSSSIWWLSDPGTSVLQLSFQYLASWLTQQVKESLENSHLFLNTSV